jgi:putative transposase
MARQPRYAIPGQPQHVIQRGNNKVPIFGSIADYVFFKECVQSASARFECAMHAYVLMTNHVHLLVTPGDATGIGRMMQSVGRKYVRFFNDRNARTGTLWEGRYRATVVDSDEYLFTCYRYIEQNPVRAGLVSDPSRYRWSSHGFNALGTDDALVVPHERYLALGPTPSERQKAYRAICVTPSDPSVIVSIRYATNHGWALGSERFRQEVTKSGRRAAPLLPAPSC